tara:strand:- start:55984 stop:56805 length:822 start_codon:yes stop_codon:yes gene_type:complete
MSDLLQQSLLNRYRLRTLGHFYILNADEESTLNTWAKNFLLKVLADDGASEQVCARRLEQGHPDILWLSPSDGNYKIENKDFDPLFQAMAHRPLELPWRFIIIEKPQCIGDAYANKLLKTLEEPSDFCTIIFLQAGSNSLMQTIESRGIKLRLHEKSDRVTPTPSQDQSLSQFLSLWSESYPELYDAPLELSDKTAQLASELATLTKSKFHLEENIINGVLCWAQYQVDDSDVLEEIIDSAQHGHLSKIYNNSNSERLFSLVNATLSLSQRSN